MPAKVLRCEKPQSEPSEVQIDRAPFTVCASLHTRRNADQVNAASLPTGRL